MGDYGLRGINAHYGAVGDIGAEPGGDGPRTAAYVNDFEVWLDVGQKECSVFGGGTGGVGTNDGFVMALGICTWVGVHGSHDLSSKRRYKTLLGDDLVARDENAASRKSEQYSEETWDVVLPQILTTTS